MKIAMFDNLFDGGAKRVVFEQLKHLSKKHDVSYFTNLRSSYFDFSVYAKDIHRYDLELFSHHGMFRLMREVSFVTHIVPTYKHIAEEMNAYDAAIVHPSHIEQAPLLLHYLTIPTLYYAEEWMREVYEPQLHPIETSSVIKRSYEKLRRNVFGAVDWIACRSARKVAVNSEHMSKKFKQVYRRNSQVIYPGVDAHYFRPQSEPQRKHFLFVGRKHYHNGYDLLESALNSVELPFNVVYVEPNENGLHLTDAEMLELYQKSVATLCLSRGEPFGLTAIESMACSTPVIAMSDGGYAETVAHKKTGYLIDNDPQALVKHMKDLAVQDELREEMGRNGRAHVSENYSWKSHVDQVLEELS